MYIARFSYDVLPVNRQAAIDFIRREVEAARSSGLNARLLVPLTRGHGGAALLVDENEPSVGEYKQISNHLECDLHWLVRQEHAVKLLPRLIGSKVTRVPQQFT